MNYPLFHYKIIVPSRSVGKMQCIKISLARINSTSMILFTAVDSCGCAQNPIRYGRCRPEQIMNRRSPLVGLAILLLPSPLQELGPCREGETGSDLGFLYIMQKLPLLEVQWTRMTSFTHPLMHSTEISIIFGHDLFLKVLFKFIGELVVSEQITSWARKE